MSSADIILEVRNLCVEIGGERIIDNLSFTVKEGEILTIIGPNGAGKTTLLRALLGLIPYKGSVKWKNGIKISYLPQRLSKDAFSYFPISVKDFFAYRCKDEKKIVRMLKKVGLSKEILEKNPANLSTGQFQRMLIAWSLITEPDVLLYDEPMSGIDLSGEETIYSLLKKFWKKRSLTILLVTHDLNVVYAYSTNCLCMSKAKFCYGPPKKILTPEALQEIYGMKIKFYKHEHGW